MTAVWPRLQIDATAAAPGGGTFIVDHSALDGSDVAATGPDYVYVPDADIRRVSLRRGGSRWRYDAGEVIVELDNTSGDYDPDNPGGAYSTLGRSLLVPGMLGVLTIRVYDYYEPVVFTGRLSDARINVDPMAPRATWVFTDDMAVAGRIEVSEYGGAVDSAYRIGTDLLEEGHIASFYVGADV